MENNLDSEKGSCHKCQKIRTRSVAGMSNWNMNTTSFCAMYLGGYDSVVNAIAKVLKEARERQSLTHEQFDKLCLLDANFKTPSRLPLCRSNEYERDPRKINSLVFSLAALTLDLRTDTILKEHVLKRELTSQERVDLAGYMKNNGLGTEFASGGDPNATVTFEQQVEVFLACKMFDEIDSLARTN